MSHQPNHSVEVEKMSTHTSTDDGAVPSHPEKAKTASADQEAPKQSTTLQKVTTAQDWTGPDDPENPMNWSFGVKAWHTIVPGLQCFTITFGSSVFSPGVPSVMRDFDVGLVAAIIPLTVYVMGLGFGPVISAPLSETFGRKSVYLLLFPASLCFVVGAGFAKTYGTLVACRFLAGFMGSGPLAVGAGTNSDLYAPIHRAAASAAFIMMPFLGPALGPPVGGFAAMSKGWRWTQWPIVFIGVVAYLITIPSRETYKKIILQKRAKKFNLPPPPNPIPPGLARIKFLLMVTIFRPIRMLLTEPIVIFFSIYTAFNFSVLFGFFAAFPIVFQSPYPQIQVYHFSTGESGLVFLSMGLGVIIGVVIFIVVDRVGYRKKTLARRKSGDVTHLPPEERLYSAMIGSFLLPIGLFWFGWSARSDVHWIVPVISNLPFAAGNMLVFCSCALYLIDTYGPLCGASAMAANGLLRYAIGAVFPLFTSQMYLKLGVGWGTSVFAFVTVGLLPIPWVLYKYGPRIRAKSAYT